MEFTYTKDHTTVDEIIDHILMRLNTDFINSSLRIHDFCKIPEDNYYDTIMAKKVAAKMYKFGIAEESYRENVIVLASKGIDIYENGGWMKFIEPENQREKLETYYSKIYDKLKQGNPDGIILDKIFSNEEKELFEIEQLYYRCINLGFAEKGKIMSFGNQYAIKLSENAKFFDNYQDFKKYSMKSITTKNETNIGNITLGERSNLQLLSPNSRIETPESVLDQLENMIELLQHNQNMDSHFKAKLIDMNTELQSLLTISKENKLPIIDSLVSLAASFASLFSAVKI